MDYWDIVWKDFKNGSTPAFEKIYYKYIDVLSRYGSKITNDKDILKDCIQQLFLEIYSSRKNLINPQNLEFYLIRALKRIIIHRMNGDAKQGRLKEDELFNFELEFEDDLTKSEKNESKMKLLKDVVGSLSNKKRELIFLKFYSGLKNDQIALVLNMKPAAVQKQIYRTLKQLQVKFEDRIVEL